MVIILYALTIIFIFPYTIFNIAAGFIYTKVFKNPIYGFFMGALVSIIASIIGSMVAHFLSKFVFGTFIKE